MVLVLNPKAFRLPRIEKEKFVNLIRLGLAYNSEQGTFSVKSYDSIDKIIETVSNVLGDSLVFQQTCVCCGKNFGCSICNYKETCATKNLPFSCVCPQCLNGYKQVDHDLTVF
jgi:hypothetical protein